MWTFKVSTWDTEFGKQTHNKALGPKKESLEHLFSKMISNMFRKFYKYFLKVPHAILVTDIQFRMFKWANNVTQAFSEEDCQPKSSVYKYVLL